MCQSCTPLLNSQRERVLSCPHTAVHISTLEGADAYKCNDCGVRLTINFVPIVASGDVPIISGEEWAKGNALETWGKGHAKDQA